jgi:hypothetical protein
MHAPLIGSAAVLVAAIAFAASASGAGEKSFSDSAGDASAALDITNVTVSSTGSRLTFRIEVANVPVLGEDDLVGVAIDADRNEATGRDGVDDVVLLAAGAVVFGRWDGSTFAETLDHQPIGASYANGATITIDTADLGGTKSFDFFVLGIRGDSADDAPDTGWWTYDVQQPALKSAAALFAPRNPVAGGTFRVVAVELTLDDGTRAVPGSYSCRATLAGRPLTGRGAGKCRWTLPRSARGKLLAVTISGSYGGSRATDAYVFRVR